MTFRLYNPFRWHLCQFDNGKFAARKLCALGWEYMGGDGFSWADYPEYDFVQQHAATDEQEARRRLATGGRFAKSRRVQ